ncbi:MAG: DJ-1/PfpI/YhbO family deglycase/protease [Candidatus Lokiarchaeota archaeon]|nr:DJ-1/PfpI/YhbO family deglycase/protease [Candidatus Lokiarchaeota archaeon]
MSLSGKKLIILVEKLYEDLELWFPYYYLKGEGAHINIVSPESNITYKGKNGYPVTSDLGVFQVNLDNIDGLLIPGGFAPDYLRRNNQIVQLVKDAYNSGKLIAAICHGPAVLINAGILAGKKVTCFMAIKQDVINAGAEYLDQEVVQDVNLITSRKPDDLSAYCKAIISFLTQ